MTTDHAAKGKRFDWDKIALDYITHADSTLRKMSEKYGVSFRMVTEHSRLDGWSEQKRKHLASVRKKAATRIGNQTAKALARELKSVDKASKVVEKMFNDLDQFNRHLVTTSASEDGVTIITTDEKLFRKVDARALKDTLSCLKMIEDMKRSMMEEQKLAERQRYAIERERLELERERLELEKQRHEMNKPDTSTVIRIEGYEEGWDE